MWPSWWMPAPDPTGDALDSASPHPALKSTRDMGNVGTRGLLIRCTAIGVGLLAALVLTEGMLRLLHLAPTNGLATVTEAEFRAVPGLLSPHQNFVDRRDPRLPHRVTTNSLGYRGSEFPLRKERGEVRVLFTGDSFAYGDFVNDDQTLTAQLAKRLAGSCASVRVINAGLDAATIVDEARMIARGLVVSPDLVVLLFSENDVVDLNRRATWDMLAENRRAKSRLPFSVLYPLLRRTALWNFALQVRAASWNREVRATKLEWAAATGEDSVTSRLREAYQRELLALRDTLAARRIPFVLVAYPLHFAVLRPSMRGQLVWLARAAATTRVPMVNLLTPLGASGLPADSLYFLPYDGHPSPRGYAIAAAYLADRLRGDGLLGPRCHAGPH